MKQEYWKELTEKYFDGETTPAEEASLRRFLSGTEDPAFDDVKAVMGYFSIRKRHRAARRSVRRIMSVAAAAAAISIVAVLGPHVLGRDTCMMVAYGEKTTDKTIVMNDVHDTLTSLFVDDQGPDVAGQLSDLFN